MPDRRRYTGAKSLQTAWSGLLLVVMLALGTFATDLVSPLVLVGGGGAVWILGLVAIGLYDSRHWRRLVAASSFECGLGPQTADLEQLRHGQSVTVTTDVPGIFSQTHTTVRANVDSVDASFTVRLRDADAVDGDPGLTTGIDALDQRYVVEGSPENVKALLSDGLVEALLDLETPGTITASGDAVLLEVPFDRLTPAELESMAETVAVIASRIEAVASE